jgi:perosamine synthetase
MSNADHVSHNVQAPSDKPALDSFEALAASLPKERAFIPLHEPFFDDQDKALVLDCLDSGWVSSVGSYVDQFERDLASYCGVKRAVVVMNGTAALHASLVLSGVQAGDEVLTPSLTFVATVNAIHYAHATPHFVDVNDLTLGVCPWALREYLERIARVENNVCYNKETGAPIRALFVMHCFGHPVHLDDIKSICDAFHITLLEDAAEALGSTYHGRHVGYAGDFAALSFNGNKIITTGGGGAILTDDEELGVCAKHLTTTAKLPHAYEFIHDQVGYNYRMPNLNAALGVAQLQKMPSYLEKKKTLAARYASVFDGIDGVSLIKQPEGCESNYWLNALRFETRQSRDAFLEQTNRNGIMTRPIWQPMHMLGFNQNCPSAPLPQTHMLFDQLVNIPSSVDL